MKCKKNTETTLIINKVMPANNGLSSNETTLIVCAEHSRLQMKTQGNLRLFLKVLT